MSDSEVEFESADEGSQGADGWEIESDFDLPDVKPLSVESKPTGPTSSTLSNVSDKVNTEQNVKYENENTKQPEKNDAPSAVLMAQSKLDKLVVNSDSHTQPGPKVSEVVQNEIKQTNTQVSEICLLTIIKLKIKTYINKNFLLNYQYIYDCYNTIHKIQF